LLFTLDAAAHQPTTLHPPPPVRRYSYAVDDTPWHVMPTLDYYGLEHEDAVSGIVAERDGVLFSRDGWGGVPFDVTLCLEKDKSSMCLQGENNLTVVHSVKPFGPRHISQVTTSFETLRPQLKDVLYTVEWNTFRWAISAGCAVAPVLPPGRAWPAVGTCSLLVGACYLVPQTGLSTRVPAHQVVCISKSPHDDPPQPSTPIAPSQHVRPAHYHDPFEP
jgi:hypothetical protein